MIKVLIVDDTKSVHAFVRAILKSASDLELTSVQHGEEALSSLLTPSAQYDVILLDWEMPVMDGPTTLAKLAEFKITTPVVMMTTKNDPNDLARMLQSGVSEYIMKPFTRDILAQKIAMVTGKEFKYAA